MKRGPEPWLLTVSVFVMVVPTRISPKSSESGLSTRRGRTPLPERETVTLGTVGSSVVKIRLPVEAASTTGVKDTVRVLLAPGGRSNAPVEETVKAELPLMATLVMRTVVVPVLLTVTDRGALTVLTR
jgi:hypothetical protein